MEFTARLGLRITWLSVLIIGFGLLAATLTTTPDKVGPFGITLWFVGFLAVLGGVLTIGLYYFLRLFRRRASKEAIFVLALRRGVLISIWLTALIALNSLRQLGLKDIVLISLLVVLIEFYLRRVR